MLTFYTNFVSHNEAHRYYCIFFKVSRIIDWFPYKMESHYHGVVHGCSACFVSVHYFDYHVSLNLANILHNFCVSQWSSSIVSHTFQSISHHWFFPYELDSHYHVVVHGCITCFIVSIIFDYHVSKILLTFYTIFVSHNEDLR